MSGGLRAAFVVGFLFGNLIGGIFLLMFGPGLLHIAATGIGTMIGMLMFAHWLDIHDRGIRDDAMRVGWKVAVLLSMAIQHNQCYVDNRREKK